MLKKISVLLIIFSVFFLSQVCLAAPKINDLTASVAKEGGYDTPQSSTALSESVGQIIKVVLGFVGVIFLGLTVYAGIIWMTATGNEEKITTATNILKASVVGLIIVVSAYSITYFVTKRLVGAATTSTTKPVGGTQDTVKWSW